MGNALSAQGGPPPAPNPQPQAIMGAQGTPMGPGGPPAAPQGQPMPPPAPSHQQTVAALRHFSAIEKELTELLKNPDLGKSDLKSAIIDGTTKLVADGILTAASAVTELGTVPEKPFDQKKWLEHHFVQTLQAANAVLSHHAAAFSGQQVDTTPASPDDHQSHMAGLMSNYARPPNG